MEWVKTMVTRQVVSRGIDEEMIPGYGQSLLYILNSKDLGQRFAFAKHFPNANEAVAEAIAVALTMLTVFTHKLDANDQDRLRVMSLMFAVMNQQVSSFKLFMLGHTIAAGAQFRQVIEGVALGFLFSVRSLDFLARFDAEHYTGSGAVDELRRKAEYVHVRKESLQTILEAYHFYHMYAHLTKFTLAAATDFTRGAPHLGALFDQAKLKEYGKEVRSRVSFARRMPNAVYGICKNLTAW